MLRRRASEIWRDLRALFETDTSVEVSFALLLLIVLLATAAENALRP